MHTHTEWYFKLPELHGRRVYNGVQNVAGGENARSGTIWRKYIIHDFARRYCYHMLTYATGVWKKKKYAEKKIGKYNRDTSLSQIRSKHTFLWIYYSIVSKILKSRNIHRSHGAPSSFVQRVRFVYDEDNFFLFLFLFFICNTPKEFDRNICFYLTIYIVRAVRSR